MYCKYCGCETSENATFCHKCGAFIEFQEGGTPFNFNNFSSDGVTSDDLRLFVGIDNLHYYMEKWQKYMDDENSLSPSWNWAAFLFGFLWLAYRKMYLLAFLAIPINFISILVNSSLFTSIISWSLCFLLALFGNKLYFHHSKNQIKKIKEKNYEDKILENKILNRGGTSIGALAAYILTCFLFAFILASFQI